MLKLLTQCTSVCSFVALTACGSYADEGSGERPESAPEHLASAQSARASSEFVRIIGERTVADPRDALLAALGTATLECLGTVTPSSYRNEDGFLARTFDRCADDPALEQIDALLGVQHSAEGQRDQLAQHYVATWAAIAEHLVGEPFDSTWERLSVLNPPSAASVRDYLDGTAPAEEGYVYAVSSTACGDGACAVDDAVLRARGFGSQFLVSVDADASSVTVDPAWWLTTYEFGASAASNPFMTPGYYHAMSYYGDVPGALYGALQRAGEACSKYDAVTRTHYVAGLKAIDCGGGWICMSYCM
jgi:hypothetical protein